MVWISRLTLIAYLVGGWLLPASHFHAHPMAAGCGEVHAVGHAHTDHDHSGHHHHGCADSHGSDSESAPLPLNGGYSQRAASDHQHSGLCSICAARTLASTTAKSPRFDGLLVPHQTNHAVPLARFIQSDVCGANLMRGPPEIA